MTWPPLSVWNTRTSAGGKSRVANAVNTGSASRAFVSDFANIRPQYCHRKRNDNVEQYIG